MMHRVTVRPPATTCTTDAVRAGTFPVCGEAAPRPVRAIPGTG